MHLVLHLPTKAINGGHVHNRLMYPTERYISALKKYVSHWVRLEGSIVEGYFVNEALTFCSTYFHNLIELIDI